MTGPAPTLAPYLAVARIGARRTLAARGEAVARAFFFAALMFGNNLIFFLVWWILLDRVEEIGGWRLADMSLLYGVVAAAYGLSVVFAGGIRELARLVADGALDPLLTQPKSVLLHVGASRSRASGWGDLVSGVLLGALALAAGGAGLTAAITVGVFAAGLRRYESGSRFVATGA